MSKRKKSVADGIRGFVDGGGFLFAMCGATETLELAIAGHAVDIAAPYADGSNAAPIWPLIDLAPVVGAEVPEVELVERGVRVLRPVLVPPTAQPGVDRARGPLAGRLLGSTVGRVLLFGPAALRPRRAGPVLRTRQTG